jgi:hypothetical protein
LLDIEPMSPVFPVLGARFHRELQAGRNMGDSVRTRSFALLLVASFAGASDAAPLRAADSLSLLQSEVHGTSQPVQLPSVASEDAGSSPSSEEERDGPHLQARIGGGMNWLRDPVATELGFNLTYAVDWYPRKPVIFSFESDFGRLGQTGLMHLRGTSGLTWRGCEAYVGYDYLEVGRFDLHGLVAGVRLWF